MQSLTPKKMMKSVKSLNNQRKCSFNLIRNLNLFLGVNFAKQFLVRIILIGIVLCRFIQKTGVLRMLVSFI